jgi:hypothetical protein
LWIWSSIDTPPSVLGFFTCPFTGFFSNTRPAKWSIVAFSLDRLFAANPDFSSAEADLLAACILEARGRLPEALSAYERLCATYPGEEAKGRMALLLQRTGAEQRAGAIVAEIRKSVERGPAFYRRAQREWYEIARRHA